MSSEFFKNIFFVGLFLAGALSTNFVQSAQSPMPTPLEITKLPKYCQAKFSSQSRSATSSQAQNAAWAQRMGGCWSALHHYCFALNWINRSKSMISNKEGRNYAINAAQSELNYTIGHWANGQNCGLLKEAEIKKSMVEMMRKYP